MEEYKKFITQFRCKSGEAYSHTSIDEPKGSFKIPEDKLNQFYDIYTRAMVQGVKLYLTEKPIDPSPMRLDLDFRFAMDEPRTTPINRKYTIEHVKTIVEAYNSILAKYIESPVKFTAYVMEKTKPTEHRGKIKDGIHIIWPHLIVSHSLQHLIRKHMLDDATNLFNGLNTCNPYEDIIDQAIIDKNNWQMYGSRKPDCEAYRVTHIYEYDKENMIANDIGMPSATDELTFPRLFSMRDKESLKVTLIPEKEAELEEYIRHILPSMDERRKTKLHKQVFGKCNNNAKNLINDDDLNMARMLVADCLLPSRADNYEEWVKLGWTLRNIDYRLLESWIEFSRVSNKYIEGECQNLWNKMKNDTLGMGTLRWWARNDNPKEYENILKNNVEILIDKCIGSDGAHYDVAMVVHALFKDRYRFTSKDSWYTFVEHKHRWVHTREGLKLRMVLSNDICTRFLKRAVYWTDKARVGDDEVEREKYNEKSKKLGQIAIRLKTAGYKDSVMKECKGLFTDEKFEEVLDSHPYLIGFENGVYDLRMAEFRDGLPDDYISFNTGRNYCDYDPQSIEAREINSYLAQVFTNEPVREYMKDIMACMIDGGIRQEKFYIYTGSGSNSKSALLNLVQKAIGDYYCILPIALLTQKRAASNSAQSELERTKGRRIAVMQEPGESEKLNIGLMKELSGGDRIMARGLFKEPIEFRPQFKMIMTCNELPEVPSDDGGTWRRIRVIEYTSKFTDNPDPNNPREFPLDPELLDKFERWADVFISMLIARHKNLDVQTINEPVEVRHATEGYKKNNDVIGQYVGDRIEKDETSTQKVMLAKMYSDFRSWAHQVIVKGKKVPDRNQFKAYLEKSFGVYPKDGKGWRGLKYKSIADDADSDIE
jgi:P4 family phage/plasmid primase-like protien